MSRCQNELCMIAWLSTFMWEFPEIKQNRTLYAQANSNLPIRIQTVEQLISRYSKQQRAAGCYYNRQQTRSSLAADSRLSSAWVPG
jgi:hypothetical protein